MTFRSVGTVFVIAICLSANNDVLGATTFDTTPSWNGSTIGAFGKGYTTTYGQTFIAPADSRLDDFTFYLRGNVSVHLSMKAYVFSWTGSLLGGGGGQATGNPLYVSPGSVVLDGNNTYQPITVNTGGTLLAPGQQYVALLTLSNPSDFDVSIGATVWNNRSSHVPNNGGGGFVYFNNASDIGALNTKVWDHSVDYGDLVWTAHFGVVPEPSSFALAAMAVTGVALAAWRQRGKRR